MSVIVSVWKGEVENGEMREAETMRETRDDINEIRSRTCEPVCVCEWGREGEGEREGR